MPVIKQLLVARTPVSPVSNLCQSYLTSWIFCEQNHTWPQSHAGDKKRSAFIWLLNLFVFVRFLLRFQYFSDWRKWLTLCKWAVPHMQLFVTVQSRQWAWLWTISHRMYSLLTAAVVQFAIFVAKIYCKWIVNKLSKNTKHIHSISSVTSKSNFISQNEPPLCSIELSLHWCIDA